MANSPETPKQSSAEKEPEKKTPLDSHFPIELTELDLDKVVGGAGDGNVGVVRSRMGTVMCCW